MKNIISITTTSLVLGLSTPMGYAMEEKLSETIEVSLPIATVSISTTQPQIPFRSVDQILSPLLETIKNDKIRADIQEALNLIPETEQEKGAPNIVSIFNNTAGDARKYILHTLKEIPANERESIVEIAMPLFQKVDAFERAKILQILKGIPANERLSIVEIAIPLFQDLNGGNGRNNSYILQYLSEIPAHERISTVEIAMSLFLNLDGIRRGNILYILNKVPVHERESIVEIARFLFEGLPESEYELILEGLNLIPANERLSIVRIALPFINNSEFGGHRANTLLTLNLIPANERESIAKIALPICKGQNVYRRNALLIALNFFPANERESIAKIAISLFLEENGYARIGIIAALDMIPIHERGKSAHNLFNLKNKDKSDFEKIIGDDDKIIAFLMTTDLSIKESLISHWSQILSSSDEEKTKALSKLIIRKAEAFGLNEFDPIVQQAKTYLSIATNKTTALVSSIKLMEK